MCPSVVVVECDAQRQWLIEMLWVAGFVKEERGVEVLGSWGWVEDDEDEDGEKEWGLYSLSKASKNARKSVDKWYHHCLVEEKKARETARVAIVLPSVEWWMNRWAKVG